GLQSLATQTPLSYLPPGRAGERLCRSAARGHIGRTEEQVVHQLKRLPLTVRQAHLDHSFEREPVLPTWYNDRITITVRPLPSSSVASYIMASATPSLVVRAESP